MNTEGVVDGTTFANLDDFTRAFIEALFWTEEEPGSARTERANVAGKVRRNWRKRVEEGQQKDMPGDYCFGDMASETLVRLVEDCGRFKADAAPLLESAYELAYDASQAGHDFWLTRNGHGTGFWDRQVLEPDLGDALSEVARKFGEMDIYIGDDLKIYCM